ncbi:MAG TPA: hypothetical protein VH796_19345 [Nitrososphaeraceae archaeon]
MTIGNSNEIIKHLPSLSPPPPPPLQSRVNAGYYSYRMADLFHKSTR